MSNPQNKHILENPGSSQNSIIFRESQLLVKYISFGKGSAYPWSSFEQCWSFNINKTCQRENSGVYICFNSLCTENMSK